MARITNRNFLPGFQNLEIEYGPDQRGPDVSDDIQMTYNMGNAAPQVVEVETFVPGWAAPSPILVEYHVNALILGVVAEFNQLQIQAAGGGGGIWVFDCFGDTNGFVPCRMYSRAAFTAGLTPLTVNASTASAWGDGSAPASTIQAGTDATDSPLLSLRMDITNSATIGKPSLNSEGLTGIYLGPGRVFVLATAQTGASRNMGFHWREIL